MAGSDRRKLRRRETCRVNGAAATGTQGPNATHPAALWPLLLLLTGLLASIPAPSPGNSPLYCFFLEHNSDGVRLLLQSLGCLTSPMAYKLCIRIHTLCFSRSHLPRVPFLDRPPFLSPFAYVALSTQNVFPSPSSTNGLFLKPWCQCHLL